MTSMATAIFYLMGAWALGYAGGACVRYYERFVEKAAQ